MRITILPIAFILTEIRFANFILLILSVYADPDVFVNINLKEFARQIQTASVYATPQK
jgi:hypothetical protein